MGSAGSLTSSGGSIRRCSKQYPLDVVRVTSESPGEEGCLARASRQHAAHRADARDGTGREDRPCTVTESAYGLREENLPNADDPNRSRVFFPFAWGHRTTDWERGDDPLTRFTFSDDFDEVGQPSGETQIACPRGWRAMDDVSPGHAYLATRSRTAFGTPIDPDVYIRVRPARLTRYRSRMTVVAPLPSCGICPTAIAPLRSSVKRSIFTIAMTSPRGRHSWDCLTAKSKRSVLWSAPSA